MLTDKKEKKKAPRFFSLERLLNEAQNKKKKFPVPIFPKKYATAFEIQERNQLSIKKIVLFRATVPGVT